MKRLLVLFLMFVLLVATACEGRGTAVENAESEVVDSQQAIYQKAQPIHIYQFSQIRDSLIQIYDQLVKATTTYTVITSAGTGQLLFECPSYGFPIPADTQLTNPVQVDWTNDVTLDQAEPGGVFTSKNTDGTYVLCVRKKGDVGVVYTEQKVTAFGFGVICNEDGYCVDDENSATTLGVDVGQ